MLLDMDFTDDPPPPSTPRWHRTYNTNSLWPTPGTKQETPMGKNGARHLFSTPLRRLTPHPPRLVKPTTAQTPTTDWRLLRRFPDKVTRFPMTLGFPQEAAAEGIMLPRLATAVTAIRWTATRLSALETPSGDRRP